jgi:hypothetical protein
MSYLQKSWHLYDVESSYPRKNTSVFRFCSFGDVSKFSFNINWGGEGGGHDKVQIPSSGPHSYNPFPHHYDVIQGPPASEGLEEK